MPNKQNSLTCLNKGEPSSKAKYDIQAIVNSTEREGYELVIL